MTELRTHLAFAAVAVGILAWSAPSRAQSCEELREMSWNDASRHIYLVHALNRNDRVSWAQLLGGTRADQPVRVGEHMREGLEWIGGDDGYLQPRFPARPTLHLTWNHLVQPHPAGTWEAAPLVILERADHFDGELLGALPTDTMPIGPHVINDDAEYLFNEVELARDRDLAEQAERLRAAHRTVRTFTGPTRVAVAARLTVLRAWQIFEQLDTGWSALATNVDSDPDNAHHPLPYAVSTNACTHEPIFPVTARSPLFMRELALAHWLDLHDRAAIAHLEHGLYNELIQCWQGNCAPGGRFSETTRINPHTADLFVCRALTVHDFLMRFSRSAYAHALARDLVLYAVSIDVYDLVHLTLSAPRWTRDFHRVLATPEPFSHLRRALEDLCSHQSTATYDLVLGAAAGALED